jgi:hypothetical protein
LLFLFRTCASVPVSRTACHVRPNLLLSWSPPLVRPNIWISPSHSPRRRNFTQPVRWFPSLRSRMDAAAAEAPAGLAFFSPQPDFQRTAATGGNTHPV